MIRSIDYLVSEGKIIWRFVRVEQSMHSDNFHVFIQFM
jgi:hypothetical protein